MKEATEAQRHGEEEEVGRQKRGIREKVIGMREGPPSSRTALWAPASRGATLYYNASFPWERAKAGVVRFGFDRVATSARARGGWKCRSLVASLARDDINNL